ncbi:acetate--CoA ligase family protein [Thalassobaculum sp. OXR-137]|uniref:acetate--CoA ligase family protein n=1 Tax=Thalassobaculum sp. OXR-137 TaxID=3100173 RepID=UPI002AC94469|nr:acetate--CoA ligase family protein [Thalassobaculum sp. OXR-137]WPZ35812.1 acetate--CoA ligase family protein [Thalassobaculum sp. OXR-137]
MADSKGWIDALVRPATVAVVGASDDPKKDSARPLRFLRKHGFAGTVWPINPMRETVLGEKAWPSLAALPAVPEHVYIVTAAERVEEQVVEAARLGVKVATVLADGFAEAGEDGAEAQRRLVEKAHAGGMRLLGPNSMGAANVADRTPFTTNAAWEAESLKPGRLMALSQSGSLIGTLVSRGAARGIGFHSLVSVGNEADLDVGAIGEAAVGLEEVDAFVLFLETVRRPERIAAFARAADAAGKPIVVYKLGRSPEAQALAVSHTGALVGSDKAADAFFRDLGILRVDQFEALLELPALLKGRRPDASRRSKPVAVVTTTGGGGAMAVDRLGAAGIAVEGASDALRAHVKEAVGLSLKPARLIDVTLAGARYEVMKTVLDGLLDSGDYAAVVAAIGSSAQFLPERAVQPIVDCAGHATPIAAAPLPQADRALAMLSEAEVAGFRSVESMADAVRAFIEWTPPKPVPTEAAPEIGPARPGAVLGEADGLDLLDRLGMTTVGRRLLGVDEAIPDDIAYPVVLKAVSADLPHKTEAGAVALGLTDRPALAAARDAMREHLKTSAPGAVLEGWLVQTMVRGLGEALVGYRVDPEVGPVISVAPGGIFAELYEDVAVRTAPVDLAGAREMIAQVKGLKALAGWRGKQAGDLEALARAVVSLSTLALDPELRVAEAEANPVMVLADGAVAVDALVSFA